MLPVLLYTGASVKRINGCFVLKVVFESRTPAEFWIRSWSADSSMFKTDSGFQPLNFTANSARRTFNMG